MRELYKHPNHDGEWLILTPEQGEAAETLGWYPKSRDLEKTRAEDLRTQAEALGLAVPPDANKGDLVDLLAAHQSPTTEQEA